MSKENNKNFDVELLDEFNIKIHKRINEIINELLNEYKFVKKVKYRLSIDI